MSAILLIFVKHPEAGKVKTRLAASIGHEKAVKVYQRLLVHTAEQVAPLPIEVAVFYGNRVPKVDLWSERGYNRFLQEGSDLGERMLQAFQWAFDQGYQRVGIIGSDCAKLTTGIIQQAFELLEKQDAVIGPAEDGGYYLLGMRTLYPQVFANKEWSTDTVFSATLKDLETEEVSYSLLPTLSDVDTLEDIPGTFLELFLRNLE